MSWAHVKKITVNMQELKISNRIVGAQYLNGFSTNFLQTWTLWKILILTKLFCMTRSNNHDNGEARAQRFRNRQREKRRYQKELKKKLLATDINFLQEKLDGISANRSAGKNEIQISVNLPHENFGIREVDHHSDLRANMNCNIINIEESTLNPEFPPLELEKYQNENSSISKIQESGSDESEASEPDQGIGNHNSILALTPIEIYRDTFACIGNNDGREFVTVNSREENTRQTSSLENSNFGDQSGSSPSAHFKHDMRADSTPPNESYISKRDRGNTPPKQCSRQDTRRYTEHGQWLLENL